MSLHKYLYAHSDPVSGTDPTGLSFLAAIGGFLGSMAMRVSHGVAAYGEFYYVLVATTLWGLYQGVGAVWTGVDPETGEELSNVGRASAGVFVMLDILPPARVVRRVFPKWASVRLVASWVRTQMAQHTLGSRRGMAAALQFSEEIVEGTLRSNRSNVEGADIVAEAVVDGVQGTLKREVSVWNTANPNGFYGKIIGEAGQVADAMYPSIFIEVTDEAISAPGARKTLIQKAEAALIDLKNQGFSQFLRIIAVDSHGNQIFP